MDTQHERFPRFATPHRRGGGGAMILGLLIVVGIVLFLMFGSFGGGSSYMENVAKTKDSGENLSIDMNVRQIVQSITAYNATYGEYPGSRDDLDVDPRAFRDPWENEMTFEITKGPGGRSMVVVTSAGPDNEPGTEDDIMREEPLPF